MVSQSRYVVSKDKHGESVMLSVVSFKEVSKNKIPPNTNGMK